MIAWRLLLAVAGTCAAFSSASAQDAKRPPIGPYYNCTIMNTQCEERFLAKLKADNRAKEPAKIVADFKAGYAKLAATRQAASGATTRASSSICGFVLGGIICFGEEGIDFYWPESSYASLGTGTPTGTTTGTATAATAAPAVRERAVAFRPTVTVTCSVWGDGCIGTIRDSILKAGFKPKYDGQIDVILSEVKKAYEQGSKLRERTKQTTFDYSFVDTRAPNKPTIHIHVSWGEVLTFGLGLLL